MTPAAGPWTILFAGTFPWETGLRLDHQRFCGALADRGHTLVYVDPPVRHGPAVPVPVRAARDDPRVTLITPRTIPGRSVRPVRALAESAERRAVRQAWRSLHLPPPDAVLVHAHRRRFYWDLFPGALRLYRNYDMDGRAALMAGEADVALTMSPRYVRLGTLPADRTRYVPNTVDDAAPRPNAAPVPQSSVPLAGTMGLFGERSDLDLLGELPRRARGWRFRFQGTFGDATVPAARVVAALRGPQVEIVRATGSDRAAVDGFLSSIDVGLCAYRDLERNRYIAPDKLLAFLRAGIPVVTNPFSEETLDLFRRVPGLFIAEGADGFARALPEALEAGRDAAVREGLSRAAEPYLAPTVAALFEGFMAEGLARREA